MASIPANLSMKSTQLVTISMVGDRIPALSLCLRYEVVAIPYSPTLALLNSGCLPNELRGYLVVKVRRVEIV